MKKMMLMTALMTIAFITPALADQNRGEHRDRGYRVEKEHRQNYAQHDRGHDYQRFQKRMHKLRKELRHERRENRRLERREARRLERREARRDYRRNWRSDWHRPRPVVVAPRPHRVPIILPGLVVNIPLRW